MPATPLAPPAELWRRWVLVAAEHAAHGEDAVHVRRSDGVALVQGERGAWLRMRRLVGDRAVVWGCSGDRQPDGRFVEELRDAAPDWALGAEQAAEVGFLAWHAHGQWWTLPSPLPDDVVGMLGPFAAEEALLERWHGRWPDAGELGLRSLLREPSTAAFTRLVGAAAARRAVRQIELGRAWDQHRLSPTASSHLRSQVHAQMRTSAELDDRGVPPRPPLLRQWARVHGRGTPFRHAVDALGRGRPSGLVAGRDDNGLTDAQLRSLDNVLVELRMAETSRESGAWLFAQVTSDGRGARIERAFDTWPSWYVGTGPGMAALHDEMAERTPTWRPAWSALLPGERL